MESGIRHYIELSKSSQKQIAKAFSCCERMVVESLTYRKDTELARKIRYVALKEYGGLVMTTAPMCQTIHLVREDGKELMRQEFTNGVILEADKLTGRVVLVNKQGKQLGEWNIDGITELREIQAIAEAQ